MWADRAAAVRVLIRVENGAFASRLLGSTAQAGVRARVFAVLRWLRRLDEVLGRHLRRPMGRLDPEVRATLRLGLAEAVILGVPPPVAVDGAVRLIRHLGKGSASGMVNAVLRRAVGSWNAAEDQASPDVLLSHPAWLWERWRRAFGEVAAVEAMAADQEPAAVWVWWLDEEAPTELERRGVHLEPHSWCPGAWRAPGADGLLAAEAAAGRAYVQDPSSQLAAHVAVALAGDGGGCLADLCAAPGGKAALAARLGSWRRIAAADLRVGRVRLLRDLLGRIERGAAVLAGDAGRPALRSGSWELVLLDAPCSGTGTLRRHPELRWRLREPDVVERAAVQARLIRAACRLPTFGGVLLYATCSVEAEENEALFEEIPTGFERVDLTARLPEGVPVIPTVAGGLRLLPGPFWDGFTFHAIRRVG